MQFKRYFALAGIAFLAAQVRASGAGIYTLTPLDGIANIRGINTSGQIVGTQIVGGSYHATVWSPNGSGGYTARDLAALPSLADSHGFSINSMGQVSGPAGSRAFMWKDTGGPAGTAVDLGDPNPSGSEEIFAQAISDHGSVAAMGYDFFGGGFRAFVWRPDVPNGLTGSMIPIGGGGGVDIEPSSINNAGDVVCYSGVGSFNAFLWKGNTGTSHPIGGLPGGNGNTKPLDINNAGQIAGWSNTNGKNHAFVWTPGILNGTTGSMVDIGVLPGVSDESQANDINSFGVAVGRSGSLPNGFSTTQGLAFVWSSSDGMRDLNSLLDSSGAGWTLREASHINDVGQVIGIGQYDPDGPGGVPPSIRSFLLTAVPEPQLAACLAAISMAFARGGRHRRVRE